jgi:hypothetical protein
VAPGCLAVGKVRNQEPGRSQPAERDSVVGQEAGGSRCEVRGTFGDGSVSERISIDSGEWGLKEGGHSIFYPAFGWERDSHRRRRRSLSRGFPRAGTDTEVVEDRRQHFLEA